MEINTLTDISENVNINGENVGESAAPENNGELNEVPATPEEIGDTIAQSAEAQDMSDDKFDEYIDNIISGDANPEKDEDSVSETQEENDDENKPFKVFTSAEEYQGEIDRIFSKRFHDYKQTKDDHADLLENLCDVYGVKTPFEAASALRSDAHRVRLKNEMPQEQVTYNNYGLYPENEAAPKSYDEAYRRLFFQLNSLGQFDPSFSASEVYSRDERFRDILMSTNSPYVAYADYVRRTAKSDMPQKIKAAEQSVKKERTFREGAAAVPSSAGRVETDASRLSDEEFEKYIKKIENEF